MRVPDRALRVALAVVLALAGMKLLDPPGANAIVLTVAVVAVLAGLAAVLRRGFGVARPSRR